MDNIFDVIIIGGGPAGYTAALYAARSQMSTLIIEMMSAGGQMALSAFIENYPGFEDGIDGFDLGMKMQNQATKAGAKTANEEVVGFDFSQSIKTVTTNKATYHAKTVIIATGASATRLNVEGEEAFLGKGVAYCALCDGMFYRGKDVVVIGGGNSAAHDATYLSNVCNSVTMIHRRDQLRASREYLFPLEKATNLNIEYNTKPVKIIGDSKVSGIVVEDTITGEQRTINADGVFVSIGRTPNTTLFKDVIELDSRGYIVADESCTTNVEGVFVAGDVRTKHVRQVTTAVSDGAIAATKALEYISQQQ